MLFANPRAVLGRLRRAREAVPADLAVLAEAVTELKQDVARFGRLAACPACRVARLPVLFTAEHALACPAHPAVARARAAHAELSVLSAFAASLGHPLSQPVPPPPLPRPPVPALRCWGRRGEPDDGFAFALDEDVRDALKVLSGDPTLRVHQQVKSWAQALEVLGVGIAEHEAFAARRVSPCPGCGEPVELGELAAHLFACAKHPEAIRAAVLEDVLEQLRGPKPSTAGRLIRRRMELERGLLQLAGASLAFLSGLSDCDVGKARVDETKEQRWKRAQAEAAELLRA